MIDNLKAKYDFNLRLATKDEIKVLAEYLAKKNWDNSLKYRKPSKSKAFKVEADDFINEEKTIILELIGSKVLVQEYKKFEASIFVYNYIQEFEKNTITSLTSRVLKTKKGMELLNNEDVVFNLKDLKTKTYHDKKKERVGRPSKPKDESIQKALEIKRYIDDRPDFDMTMDEVCQEFGFSKTTYYRVIKWLETRHEI